MIKSRRTQAWRLRTFLAALPPLSPLPISMSHIIRKLAVKKSDEDGAVEPTAFINSDVMPLPPARRTWGPGAFAGLWLVCE